MIIRIYPNTSGDFLGFVDPTRRFMIGHALAAQIAELAGNANPRRGLIDRATPFNTATARHVTGFEHTGGGAWAIVEGKPSGLLLTRVELATLADAMPSD